MAQGRKKLAHQNKIEGSHRACRHDGRFDGVPQFGTPQPPVKLKAKAKALWDDVLGNLPPSMVGKVDSYKLYILCRSWEEYRVVDDEIRAGDRSREKMITRKDLISEIQALAKDFGLSPWDRTKLTVPDKMSEAGRSVLSLLSPDAS